MGIFFQIVRKFKVITLICLLITILSSSLVFGEDEQNVIKIQDGVYLVKLKRNNETESLQERLEYIVNNHHRILNVVSIQSVGNGMNEGSRTVSVIVFTQP